MEKFIAIFIVMLAAIAIGCFAFRKNKGCGCKNAKKCDKTDCTEPKQE